MNLLPDGPADGEEGRKGDGEEGREGDGEEGRDDREGKGGGGERGIALVLCGVMSCSARSSSQFL